MKNVTRNHSGGIGTASESIPRHNVNDVTGVYERSQQRGNLKDGVYAYLYYATVHCKALIRARIVRKT
ncbi:hypothetical protein AL479_23415 [Citrobacter amalonaticus]|nr:hypothetical protein AL479_23415 [Citrobacter amalonaticus]